VVCSKHTHKPLLLLAACRPCSHPSRSPGAKIFEKLPKPITLLPMVPAKRPCGAIISASTWHIVGGGGGDCGKLRSWYTYTRMVPPLGHNGSSKGVVKNAKQCMQQQRKPIHPALHCMQYHVKQYKSSHRYLLTLADPLQQAVVSATALCHTNTPHPQ